MVWDFEFERDFPFFRFRSISPLFQHPKDIYGKLQTEECNLRYCIFVKKAPKSVNPGVSKSYGLNFLQIA
jgi:hypothetical protein